MLSILRVPFLCAKVPLKGFAPSKLHLLPTPLDEFNTKGPLLSGMLLVLWDGVAMFPDIDNNLGLTAIRKALESRIHKFPSTACILEAVEICLKYNSCQFLGKNLVEIHRTAVGPKMHVAMLI